MNLHHSITLSTSQKAQVLRLWNNEFPQDYHLNNIAALDQYFDGLQDLHHIFILNDNEEICAWFLDFIRDQERWFTIIIDSQKQGKGLGSKLMLEAISRNSELNGWVVKHSDFQKSNGLPYSSALGFYEKLGFKVHHNIQHEKRELDLIKITYQKDGI